jgi:predicted nuclease of predicted toxin-antitoxin system
VASLHSDENVPLELVEFLRDLGHDVLTAYEAGRANQGIADADVLAYATSRQRAVLTNNRLHYHRVHRQTPGHAGIITYTNDADRYALAVRIDTAIKAASVLAGVLIRVTRPP